MSPHFYVFIGPPGAGKGSLTRLCCEKFGWIHVSTGDLCRSHVKEGTPIGAQIDFALKSGILISDELITQMVDDWLRNKAPKGGTIMLDGYPRTVKQAQLFEQFLKQSFKTFTLKVVRLFISDDAVVQRLSHRYICESSECQAVYSTKNAALKPRVAMVCDVCNSALIKRKDDEPGAIRERLKMYDKYANDLITFYLKSDYPVIAFNVEKSLEKVFEEFKSLMCLKNDNDKK